VLNETERANRIVVETARLSRYLTRPIDLLKLDIEGAETDVLQEAADQLANVRNLFVEYHSFVGKPQRLEELLGIMRRADFRVYIHSPQIYDSPFRRRIIYQGMDLQLNIFGYREPAPPSVAPGDEPGNIVNAFA
jgi:hypothetical protein